MILLYTSRACYNLVVVALSPQDRPSPFNYGWYSVSDQVLFSNQSETARKVAKITDGILFQECETSAFAGRIMFLRL